MRFLILLTLLAGPVRADPPQVGTVMVSGNRVSVAIIHPDTGWDHYADGWEVLDADGNRLGYRELAHPHVNEQPFTRSLSGVTIPDNAGAIYIRARCSVDGWNDGLTKVLLAP